MYSYPFFRPSTPIIFFKRISSIKNKNKLGMCFTSPNHNQVPTWCPSGAPTTRSSWPWSSGHATRTRRMPSCSRRIWQRRFGWSQKKELLFWLFFCDINNFDSFWGCGRFFKGFEWFYLKPFGLGLWICCVSICSHQKTGGLINSGCTARFFHVRSISTSETKQFLARCWSPGDSPLLLSRQFRVKSRPILRSTDLQDVRKWFLGSSSSTCGSCS